MFKEFLTELCKEVFDTDRGLWLMNKNNELYPNPHAYATERTFSLLDLSLDRRADIVPALIILLQYIP